MPKPSSAQYQLPQQRFSSSLLEPDSVLSELDPPASASGGAAPVDLTYVKFRNALVVQAVSESPDPPEKGRGVADLSAKELADIFAELPATLSELARRVHGNGTRQGMTVSFYRKDDAGGDPAAYAALEALGIDYFSCHFHRDPDFSLRNSDSILLTYQRNPICLLYTSPSPRDS